MAKVTGVDNLRARLREYCGGSPRHYLYEIANRIHQKGGDSEGDYERLNTIANMIDDCEPEREITVTNNLGPMPASFSEQPKSSKRGGVDFLALVRAIVDKGGNPPEFYLPRYLQSLAQRFFADDKFSRDRLDSIALRIHEAFGDGTLPPATPAEPKPWNWREHFKEHNLGGLFVFDVIQLSDGRLVSITHDNTKAFLHAPNGVIFNNYEPGHGCDLVPVTPPERWEPLSDRELFDLAKFHVNLKHKSTREISTAKGVLFPILYPSVPRILIENANGSQDGLSALELFETYETLDGVPCGKKVSG